MRLGKIDLIDHDLFGNVTVNLSSGNNFSNYTTIIIGPNGTGKSRFLGAIADVLSIELSKDKAKSLKNFENNYQLEIKNSNGLVVISNDSEARDTQVSRLLAVTSTLNDRFPFIAKNSVRKSKKYVYLGLKTTSNNIFLSNIKEKLLILLFSIANNDKKSASARNVLNKLGFGVEFHFLIKKARNFAVARNSLKGADNIEFKNSYDAKSLQSYLGAKSTKSKNDEILSILELVSSSEVYKVSIDLGNISKNKSSKSYFNILTDLLDKNIVTVGNLSLFSSTGYDMDKSSSGEFNILRSFLSIIANLKDNAIILIDEPEVSLHPNWQIDFVPMLDIALSNFKGCHTIIATHSHFMLTNADVENSSIISLSPSDSSKGVEVSELDIEPYGWSPENILYQAFGVTGNRNKYFELDLRVIIDFISKPDKDKEEFLAAMSRVDKFKMQTIDPLYPLLQTAKELRVRLT